jgi:hypothetical protein
MTQDSQKISLKMSTDLAFGIVTLKPMDQQHKMEEVIPVLSTLYPGINYWWLSQSHIAKTFAGPDLAKQHPTLADFNSSAEAVAALGSEIEIKSVRPCAGYEWQEWETPTPTVMQ